MAKELLSVQAQGVVHQTPGTAMGVNAKHLISALWWVNAGLSVKVVNIKTTVLGAGPLEDKPQGMTDEVAIQKVSHSSFRLHCHHTDPDNGTSSRQLPYSVNSNGFPLSHLGIPHTPFYKDYTWRLKDM